MALEIILVSIAIFLFLLTSIGSLLVALWVVRKPERDYPTKIPGWGTKVANLPPHITTADVARINELLVKYCFSIKGFSKKKVKAILNDLRWKFIKQDESIGRMAVYDPYNRRDKKTGEIITIAGWADGNNIYVVWAPGVSLGATAAAHECGHPIKRVLDSSLSHDDVLMFGDKDSSTTFGVIDLVKRNF